MKVIKQSFEILHELNDPIKQIASRARICYKSEDKSQEDEKPFLTRLAKHEPIFEMAVITLEFHFEDVSELVWLNLGNLLQGGKYIHVTSNEVGHILATGSVRDWREILLEQVHKSTYMYAIWEALNKYNSFLFEEYEPQLSYLSMYIRVIDDLDSVPLSAEFDKDYKFHKHVAVKFITNRAVSHELVRHRPCAFLQESQRYCRYGAEKFGEEVTFIDPRPAFPVFEDAINFETWEHVCTEAESGYLDLLADGASPQAARTVLPNSCKTEIILYCNLKEWEHIFNRRISPEAEPSMREQMIPLHEQFKELFPEMFDEPQLSVG
jgi:thymidylate synthase (FAD)